MSTPKSGKEPSRAGLSALRDASASSLTAMAPTEVASRAASRSRRSTTSSGTFRKYSVLMSHNASISVANEQNPVSWRLCEFRTLRTGLPEAAPDARIPTSRIKGPVLLVSGGDDQLWPSNTYADRIMASLHGDPSAHVHLNYPAAGHLVLDPPYTPSLNEERLHGSLIALGGTNAAYEAAHERDWPPTIQFITTH